MKKVFNIKNAVKGVLVMVTLAGNQFFQTGVVEPQNTKHSFDYMTQDTLSGKSDWAAGLKEEF